MCMWTQKAMGLVFAPCGLSSSLQLTPISAVLASWWPDPLSSEIIMVGSVLRAILLTLFCKFRDLSKALLKAHRKHLALVLAVVSRGLEVLRSLLRKSRLQGSRQDQPTLPQTDTRSGSAVIPPSPPPFSNVAAASALPTILRTSSDHDQPTLSNAQPETSSSYQDPLSSTASLGQPSDPSIRDHGVNVRLSRTLKKGSREPIHTSISQPSRRHSRGISQSDENLGMHQSRRLPPTRQHLPDPPYAQTIEDPHNPVRVRSFVAESTHERVPQTSRPLSQISDSYLPEG
ncbi:hypothetical protein BC834DRAFT_379495 [Gloeopeniophorella convolvens]|nr:hypothetical protein BC834DRAFT_379495 [Gloeopeniophorella convolvens]